MSKSNCRLVQSCCLQTHSWRKKPISHRAVSVSVLLFSRSVRRLQMWWAYRFRYCSISFIFCHSYKPFFIYFLYLRVWKKEIITSFNDYQSCGAFSNFLCKYYFQFDSWIFCNLCWNWKCRSVRLLLWKLNSCRRTSDSLRQSDNVILRIRNPSQSYRLLHHQKLELSLFVLSDRSIRRSHFDRSVFHRKDADRSFGHWGKRLNHKSTAEYRRP